MVERNIRDIPIHLDLGIHGSEARHETTAQSLRSLLDETNGSVAIVMENVSFTALHSKTLTLLTKRLQYSPSHAFKAPYFMEAHDRVGTPEELDQLSLSSDVGAGTVRELATYDNLADEYPGRLFLVPESAPQAEINHFRGKAESALTTHRELINQGKFDEALTYFKQGMDYMITRSEKREPRIVRQIQKTLRENDDVSAVFARFGTSHLPLYRKLKAAGFSNVTKSFADGENNQYIFDPGLIIGLAQRYSQIPEERLYSAMIASEVFFTISELMYYAEMEGQPLDDEFNTANKRAKSALAFFRMDMDYIRKFEEEVRENGGLLEAL